MVSALHDAQKNDIIDDLYRIVYDTRMPSQLDEECIPWYNSFITKYYLNSIHTSVASKTWLPSPTETFFNLAIIKKERIQRGKINDETINKAIRGQVDDILTKNSPIQLENIFKNIEGKRKVVLIDGAPGSGKTTLTVYICQKWSRGELFQEFATVILVQLRDPAVRNAKSIASLLPCPSSGDVSVVAKKITSTKSYGTDILWILDGWDELPSNLREFQSEESPLKDIIIPSSETALFDSSVIVTSRPIASSKLSELVSSRIEVLGFTREEQRQYFTECLKGDTNAVDTLIEQLSENPAIEGSCYLPFNASIIAHLYLSDHCLPTTVYGIFCSLIQHCLSRYLCEKLGRTKEQAQLESLSRLPQELQVPFHMLCKLAFTGTKENKVTFSQKSVIEAIGNFALAFDMGLLQATPSMIPDGRTNFFHFIHLSIQELLTALYISHMSVREQISTFKSLLGDSQFRVLQFYVAITKLQSSMPFFGKLPKWLIPKNVTVSMIELFRKIIKERNAVRHGEPKPVLVSLLHCLHEAQDIPLCQFVAKQLDHVLDLQNTSLTPVDCIVIGYFLSSVTLTSDVTVFRVDLSNCSLGDTGTKNLMQSICKNIESHNIAKRLSHLDLMLYGNEIHDVCVPYIVKVLKLTSGLSLGSWRYDSGNPIGDSGLQPIFDALKQDKTLRYLDISKCEMTDAGVASLAVALSNNDTLQELAIHGNTAITKKDSDLIELFPQLVVHILP